jgi:hypothetical protein
MMYISSYPIYLSIRRSEETEGRYERLDQGPVGAGAATEEGTIGYQAKRVAVRGT